MYELIKLILKKAETDKTGKVQQAFTRILRDINAQKTLSSFKKVLTDESEDVQREAVVALRNIDMPQEVIKLLKLAFNNESPYVQEEIVKSLRYLNIPEVVELLEKGFDNKEAIIRMEAMFSLCRAVKSGHISKSRMKELLEKLKFDENQFVSKTADFLLSPFL